MIDLCLKFVSPPNSFENCNSVCVIIVGVGSGFYLIANLGPGPRDGLMTDFNKN